MFTFQELLVFYNVNMWDDHDLGQSYLLKAAPEIILFQTMASSPWGFQAVLNVREVLGRAEFGSCPEGFGALT